MHTTSLSEGAALGLIVAAPSRAKWSPAACVESIIRAKMRKDVIPGLAVVIE
ncbi:MAG: hypothetical protein ABIT38_20160 [Gemmatimonadaceae bacterium]